MASINAPRPWRPLGALALLLVVLYGTMALLGEWTPRLGLDLRGGTSITLSARTADGTDVTDDSMRQAVDIIRARVDGSGVAESEITTQGRTNIVVQVPDVGEEDPDTEAIPAEWVSDVSDLIEQEVLLGLPIAPTHAEGACAAQAG